MDHEVVGEKDPPHPILCMTNNLRPKLCWTDQLHEVFVRAVNKLGGPFKATPKHILEEMNVKGLTLPQCKSHLQKFRLPPHAKLQKPPKDEATPKHILEEMNVKGLTLPQRKSHLQKFRLPPHAKIRKPPKDGPPKKPKPAKVPLKGAGSSSLEPCQVNHKRALDPEDFQGASMAHIGLVDQVNLSTEGGDGRSLQIAVQEACKMLGNHQDDSIANSVSTAVGGTYDGGNDDDDNDGELAISMALDEIFADTSGIINSSLPPLPSALNIFQQPTSSYFPTPITTNQVIDVSVGEYFQPHVKDNIGNSQNPFATDEGNSLSVGEYFQPQVNDNIRDSPYPLTTDQVIDVSVGEYFQPQMNQNIGDSPNLPAPPEVGTSSECSKEEDPTEMFLNMDALESLYDMLP